MSKVSVIMSVHREREEYLQQAMASLLRQTFRDLEILVYLDGRQPRLWKLLQDLAAEDPRIQVFGEEENRGLGHGLNACIDRASGEFLARMDSDDVSEPKRIERQVRFLEHHPACDFVGSNTLLFDEGGVYGSWEMKARPGREDFYGYLPFIHPSVMFRKQVFAGGMRYPETTRTLRCEDLALFMELYARGMGGCNLQEYLYRYREDKNAFAKKKYRYRLTESAVRREGYRRLGLRGIKPRLYTLKPLVVGLIPSSLAQTLKRRRDRRKDPKDGERKKNYGSAYRNV